MNLAASFLGNTLNLKFIFYCCSLYIASGIDGCICSRFSSGFRNSFNFFDKKSLKSKMSNHRK